MSEYNTDIAVGFVQEIPGGLVVEIGNRWLQRRIYVIQGRVGTASLVNGINAEEYLEETVSEFAITLAGEGQTAELDYKDFKLESYQTHEWDDACRTIELKLTSDVNSVTLPISLFYQAKAGEDFIKKWITIHPCSLDNWSLTGVTLENMRFKEMIEGISPLSRYPNTYDNREDDVHGEPDKVRLENPEKRFEFGDIARAVVTYWGYDEGLYFFTESLTGTEIFHRPTGLVMTHRDFVSLDKGVTTGAAVVGAYTGPPEIGFKRYTEYLAKNWCVMNDKSVPVTWSTWLVALAYYDRHHLLDSIQRMEEAGFYEVLHLDLGWEADAPLRVDQSRFPNGISEIVNRVRKAGLDMSYWVNPYSCNYWLPKIAQEHPEYVVPGKVSPRSNAKALCALTEYSDYVQRRFVDLATEMNARVIVWDGNDWNIPECTSREHGHRRQDELEINAIKRLASICDAAHEAREDLIISAFSLPMDNHRLCALDQEQVSDTHEFPIVQSELIQRQQLYQMAWEHPFRAIRGSWYGVEWQEQPTGELDSGGSARLAPERQISMAELIHAEMSMIANGAAQSGGGVDLETAAPEFIAFLKKLFAFRKKYERYFNTYQHVLGFPDGMSVDGSGHIINNSGFIVLVNPTDAELTVKLPLGEPELELDPNRKHKLSDWSSLERGIAMDPAKIVDAPEIELLPLEVKYIGINVG